MAENTLEVNDMLYVKTDLPMLLVLQYTDPANLVVIHNVRIEEGISVQAVGDPRNGAYEWVIRTPDWIKHSDSGYGAPGSALRDGLITYYHEVELEFPKLCRSETIRTINYKAVVEGGKKYWRYQ